MGTEELLDALKKAKELLFEDPEVAKKWKDFIKVDSFEDFLHEFELLFWFGQRIALVVEIVEKQYHLCTPEQRKEVAAMLLDDLVHFKGWFTWFEAFDKRVFYIIISLVVAAMNKYFGHAWLNLTFNDLL